MFIGIIFICLLQFKIVYNKDGDCSCSINRNERKDFVDENFLDVLQSDDASQCSDREVNKYLGADYTKLDATEKFDNMVLVTGGKYQFGTDNIVIEIDKEGPKRIVSLESFYLDKYEVSNKDFHRFTELTNYKTEAETFGDSFVFTLFLNSTFKKTLEDFRVVQAPWWYKVSGANWRHPHGPDSHVTDIMDHPVTHVSWRDARAYCAWRGARLPTEAEWEAACRGGRQDISYPWGDKLFPDHKHMTNIWQGTFPSHNSVKDGYIGTNPVHLFPQNDFGLHNIVGNVWEWTEDSWSNDDSKEKVKKGGSYLCHRSYCYRYRCSARSHNTADSSAGNLGFRCAKSP